MVLHSQRMEFWKKICDSKYVQVTMEKIDIDLGFEEWDFRKVKWKNISKMLF